jgi:molybdenum cofactor cytidylyltransferase
MIHPTPKPYLYACVLAAGKSSRFGATKLVQPFRGKPLVQHALIAAQGACEGRVLLVVGHDQDSVVEASAGLFDELVVNNEFDFGIGTSISASARACQEDADAVLVILADQPLITEAHIRNLIDTWSGAENEIVSTSFGGISGPPILFPRDAFPALSELRGDSGAKSLLSNDEFVVSSVDFPPAGFDIDSPEDLKLIDQD